MITIECKSRLVEQLLIGELTRRPGVMKIIERDDDDDDRRPNKGQFIAYVKIVLGKDCLWTELEAALNKIRLGAGWGNGYSLGGEKPKPSLKSGDVVKLSFDSSNSRADEDALIDNINKGLQKRGLGSARPSNPF